MMPVALVLLIVGSVMVVAAYRMKTFGDHFLVEIILSIGGMSIIAVAMVWLIGSIVAL